MSTGCLFLVSTPIGNLQDLSDRARQTLAEVGLIAVEDTRHSRKLLQHCGIHTSMVAVHEHNEADVTGRLIEQLGQGVDIALISDAGTPLVSDPGFRLVCAAREAGHRVRVVPGPSAALAGLCVSGLPSDRFVFEGFLPARQQARRKRLRELSAEARTLVFFESCHRISACIDDMLSELGGERRLCIARELTKLHEQSHTDQLSALPAWLAADSNRRRGEFVLVLEGSQTPAEVTAQDSLLRILADELPTGQAARLAARLTGESRSHLYDRIRQLRGDEPVE